MMHIIFSLFINLVINSKQLAVVVRGLTRNQKNKISIILLYN